MNLESKWLEDFSALAATRSFSQAAERRFVTQPAFSRRIRSLEAALGLTLVNRSRTPVELTAAGQLFWLPHVRSSNSWVRCCVTFITSKAGRVRSCKWLPLTPWPWVFSRAGSPSCAMKG